MPRQPTDQPTQTRSPATPFTKLTRMHKAYQVLQTLTICRYFTANPRFYDINALLVTHETILVCHSVSAVFTAECAKPRAICMIVSCLHPDLATQTDCRQRPYETPTGTVTSQVVLSTTSQPIHTLGHVSDNESPRQTVTIRQAVFRRQTENLPVWEKSFPSHLISTEFAGTHLQNSYVVNAFHTPIHAAAHTHLTTRGHNNTLYQFTN